jgi:hypothetical protein
MTETLESVSAEDVLKGKNWLDGKFEGGVGGGFLCEALPVVLASCDGNPGGKRELARRQPAG